jgi:hypothetical protein
MKKPRQELTLIATAEDKATKDFFAVIRYRDIRGARRKVNVPLAELSDLNALKKLLTNAGAYFTADKEENLEALRSLRASMDGAHIGCSHDRLVGSKISSCVRIV